MFRTHKFAFVAVAALVALTVSACAGTDCEQACDSFVACQDSGLGVFDSDVKKEAAKEACVTSCDSGKMSDGKALSADKIQCYIDANGSCTDINADKADGGCQGL